jgi:hypothetical protein
VRISFVGMKKGRRNIYCDSPLVFLQEIQPIGWISSDEKDCRTNHLVRQPLQIRT